MEKNGYHYTANFGYLNSISTVFWQSRMGQYSHLVLITDKSLCNVK